jgi:hypothetical protein
MRRVGVDRIGSWAHVGRESLGSPLALDIFSFNTVLFFSVKEKEFRGFSEGANNFSNTAHFL